MGSNLTYRRDLLAAQLLDTAADLIIGANFILEQQSVLFGKIEKMSARWFRHKKETPSKSTSKFS